MSLILNVYNSKTKEIEKTYTAETVEIMFGTIEDIIDIVDIDTLEDRMTWAKMVVLSIKKLRPLLKDVFVGLTDEELKNTKVNEIVPLFKDIFDFMVKEIKGLGVGGDGSKN